ncbi:elongation factor 4 [Candidatus Wolfebacteria bacterium]|nr:MAG: elongation factor 4 [Candidatus Wolfebacteria bacterium]
MDLNNIRNFSIIAHIDHGKSTLADRMLELTSTVEARKMKDQVLDTMDLERERGITIKMQPVRMEYTLDGHSYVLNLIDTPGHIDFSYEVSRALRAVEGSLLLVDSTQGVQAQTFTTLDMARELGLVIIPVLTKIDSPLARVDDIALEVSELLDVDPDSILKVSGKTGEGVPELLKEIIKKIPPPKISLPEITTPHFRALVFDFEYSSHKGVIVYVRVLEGSIKRHDSLLFKIANEKFLAQEVGIFSPEAIPKDTISAGEIGYIVTGIKKPGIASVGDTITLAKHPSEALPGYMNPNPVVWVSMYPESQDDFMLLKTALGRLRLSDASFSYEEESSGLLGRGFRSGFLGMLHLEIITERLRREFGLDLVVTTPSITYKVEYKNGKKENIYSPHMFPDDGSIVRIEEPWVVIKIITPSEYIGSLMQLLFDHEGEVTDTEDFGDNRTTVTISMPLRELMRNFFDELKSLTSGYASISYEIGDFKQADVTKLDILVADEVIPAFSKIVSTRKVQEEAEKTVEKLHLHLPRQMFVAKVQGRAHGRILASKTIKAFKKDVTAKLYGGDITRKMKLREKQKKGKKKMKERGKVNIPHSVFLKMMKND